MAKSNEDWVIEHNPDKLGDYEDPFIQRKTEKKLLIEKQKRSELRNKRAALRKASKAELIHDPSSLVIGNMAPTSQASKERISNVLPPQIDENEVSIPSEPEEEIIEEKPKETEEDLLRQYEEEFDREFEMLVSESRDQRKKESAPKEFSLGPILSLGIEEDTSMIKKLANDSIKFHVIRKGSNNKPQTAVLEIPKDSNFVKQHLKVFQEERERQEQIKRLTLKLDSMEREYRE